MIINVFTDSQISGIDKCLKEYTLVEFTNESEIHEHKKVWDRVKHTGVPEVVIYNSCISLVPSIMDYIKRSEGYMNLDIFTYGKYWDLCSSHTKTNDEEIVKTSDSYFYYAYAITRKGAEILVNGFRNTTLSIEEYLHSFKLEAYSYHPSIVKLHTSNIRTWNECRLDQYVSYAVWVLVIFAMVFIIAVLYILWLDSQSTDQKHIYRYANLDPGPGRTSSPNEGRGIIPYGYGQSSSEKSS